MLALDHVVITSRDLERDRLVWARAGFTLTPRGAHPFGTENHLITFRQTFLELFALTAPATLASVRDSGSMPTAVVEAMAYAFDLPPGPRMLALRTDDLDSDLRRLQVRGVRVSPPMSFARPVVLPDGTRTDADIEVRFLNDPYGLRLPLFISQQSRPEAVWVEDWQQHENGASDLVGVTYAVKDLDRCAHFFSRIFDQVEGENSDRTWICEMPNGRIELRQRDTSSGGATDAMAAHDVELDVVTLLTAATDVDGDGASTAPASGTVLSGHGSRVQRTIGTVKIDLSQTGR